MSGKLRPAELLTLFGTALLFVSTLLPWFALPGIDELRKLAPTARLEGSGDGGPINLNVWDLGFARWWIYLAIILGACMILAALLSRTPEWAIILCTPLVVVSGIALLCLLVRMLSSPRPYADPTGGFYLALIGGIALFAGACWAIRDDSSPAGFERAPRPELLRVD